MHEFAAVEGVVEDVTDIVLNLKKVKFKAHSREPQTLMLLSSTRKAPVTAADIQLNQNLELVNPDQLICTLDKKAEVRDGTGGQGRTRLLPRRRKQEAGPTHRRDRHRFPLLPRHPRALLVEDARVGQRTDYDRLMLEIWTDGRISPDDALTQASAILQHHLDVFVGYDKNAVEFEEEETRQDEERTKLKKLST
jgi:DNA-directed RNA polymerase subunit alpha